MKLVGAIATVRICGVVYPSETPSAETHSESVPTFPPRVELPRENMQSAAFVAEMPTQSLRALLASMVSRVAGRGLVIIEDSLLFLLLMGALSGVHTVLELLPYPNDRKAVFDLMHYYTYLILWAIFLSDLIFKTFTSLFFGRSVTNG